MDLVSEGCVNCTKELDRIVPTLSKTKIFVKQVRSFTAKHFHVEQDCQQETFKKILLLVLKEPLVC